MGHFDAAEAGFHQSALQSANGVTHNIIVVRATGCDFLYVPQDAISWNMCHRIRSPRIRVVVLELVTGETCLQDTILWHRLWSLSARSRGVARRAAGYDLQGRAISRDVSLITISRQPARCDLVIGRSAEGDFRRCWKIIERWLLHRDCFRSQPHATIRPMAPKADGGNVKGGHHGF